MTYNQVISINKAFVKAHFKLKGFGNGRFSDAILHDQVETFKYPLMFMEDLPSPMAPGVETFVFRVHFMAPVGKNKASKFNYIALNGNEVKSDMKQCAKDFLAFWVKTDEEYPEFNIEKSTTATLFEDETEDRLAGCYIDVAFRQPFTYNKCAIPAAGVTPPPDTECAAATYQNSDDSFVIEIPSGLSFTASDITLTINTVEVGDFPANQDIDINIILPAPVVYNRPRLTQQTKYNDGDEVDVRNLDTYVPPENGKLQQLDDGVYHLLKFDNAFGHKFRFTGNTGGYYDPSDGNYYDVDGNLSTEDAEFKLGPGAKDYYGIDHLTGLGWRLRRGGSFQWADALDAVWGLDYLGFDDWFIPPRTYTESLFNHDSVSWSDDPPFNLLTLTPWMSTTNPFDTGTANYILSTVQMVVSVRSKTSTAIAWYCRHHY